MSASLQGKTAIVTGASSGIGRAMVRSLAAAGCNVVAAARSEARLQALADDLDGNVLAVPTDVSDRASVEGMVAVTIDRFDGIDIVVANAGVFSNVRFDEIGPDVIDSLVDVNVRGVMHCVHAALPALREREHSDVIVVGSIAGVAELPNEPVYSPTKYAMHSFAHILRRQMREHGVRVGLISPGTVATELWGIETEEQIQARVEAQDAVTAEDVVETALFMLTRPRHVAVRDIVIVPQQQDF